jgi:hypothetical protein
MPEAAAWPSLLEENKRNVGEGDRSEVLKICTSNTTITWKPVGDENSWVHSLTY